MAKFAKIWFSKEHTGKSGQRERDTYRKMSDSPKKEKVGHNPVQRTEVPIKKVPKAPKR